MTDSSFRHANRSTVRLAPVTAGVNPHRLPNANWLWGSHEIKPRRFRYSPRICLIASGREGGSSCFLAQASAASRTNKGNLTTAVGADFGRPVFFLVFVTESTCLLMEIIVTESQAEGKRQLPQGSNLNCKEVCNHGYTNQ